MKAIIDPKVRIFRFYQAKPTLALHKAQWRKPRQVAVVRTDSADFPLTAWGSICDNKRIEINTLRGEYAPMVTESASAPRRNYWQLPTFLLGIAAMAAAYKQFPPPPPSSTVQGQSAIKSVVAAMSQKPPAWESVRDQIGVLESALDAMPDVDTPTAFLVGSWHVVAAESMLPADPTSQWQQAARRFNQVDVTKLDTSDVARFTYRQAKIDAMMKTGKPNEVLFALLNAPIGEDTSERGRYAYGVALRCTPPDLVRARAGLDEYLTGPAIVRMSQESLASLKLELGRLYLNDGKSVEAKPWIELATATTAAPDVRATAHFHLAQMATTDRNFAEAEKQYHDALGVLGLTPLQQNQVRYPCGKGLMDLEKYADASYVFAQVMQDSGPIGIAAACRLAACNARGPALNGGRNAEVEALSKCVAAIKPGGTWDNPYVGIEPLRQTFEEVIRICVKDGDLISATKAAELYERVATPGRGVELKAETYMTMAYAATAKSLPGNKASEFAKSAAKEYDALATVSTTAALKVDALRKSADALKLAGEKSAARERLEQLMNTPGISPDMLTTVRMDLADCTTDPTKAALLLQQVVENGGAQAYSARVKLAMAQLERAKMTMKETTPDAKSRANGYTSAAVTLLEQAAGAANVSPLDQASHELSLMTLGRVKMEQGQFGDAAGRLRTMLQLYPAAKEGEKAKLFLASCLLVEGTTGTGNPGKIKESLEILEPLMKSNDSFLRTQAGVRTARARLAGKQWQDAVTAATTTADDARGTLEELIALSLAYNGYAEQKRAEQCQVIETRMRRVFTELPEPLFTGNGPEYTREYWKKNWLDWFDSKPKP